MSAEPDHFKSEGDLNLSPRRKQWLADNINAETKAWLDTYAGIRTTAL